MATMTAIDRFDGENDFLSNFFVGVDGFCVENHYQAAKTDNPEWAARILAAPTPGKSKKLGRQCPIRPTWEEEKIPVMRALLVVKFSRNELMARLQATGDADLIEGNWWGDTFWGVCRGQGHNHLGRLLVWVREMGRRDDATTSGDFRPRRDTLFG